MAPPTEDDQTLEHDAPPSSIVQAVDKQGSVDEKLHSQRLFTYYKRVLVSTFYATLIVMIVIALAIIPIYVLRSTFGLKSDVEPPLLLIVGACGALGALFSSLTRLYQVVEISKVLLSPELSNLRSRQLLIYTISSPIIGAIAATVLYVSFASNLIQSDMFPKFVCKAVTGGCQTFESLLENWSPDTAQSYARALIWGFIAGFTERLIPNILGKVSTAATEENSNERH